MDQGGLVVRVVVWTFVMLRVGEIVVDWIAGAAAAAA
jgi:hypothetical protein